ncbi:MAG: HipA domain-containing protein [Acidimicrobiaceae bacterium]|nr:HipA domain-containing protein [Acidimicrobiia bacterium]MCY4495068.1 HipA domain-containing protein [Acidimicrobiaceae bacterium]
MASAGRDLYVFLHGERIGRLVLLRRGTVHLYYDSGRSPSATPLSLSLPADHRERYDVSDWVDGLLPENPRTRARMVRELGAASTAPYDLLCTRAGLECAGAVQFSPQPSLGESQTETLVKLTVSEVANHLRLISQDAAGDPSEGLGDLRLSLPGAQPKMALRLTDDGWHLPTGSLATTHILKPQRGHLSERLRNSIAVNEHLCQAAAASLGLNAARTSLEMFDNEACLVVERFDREMSGDEVRRLHFEDLCTAFGVSTAQKYQEDGGPSPTDIIALLRQENRDDTSAFFLSVYYNWLIGNTDGHAKNYGLLLDGPRPLLAPLYDLNSLAPYMNPGTELSRPAMRFGETTPTTLVQWAQTAARLGIDLGADQLEDMADALPEAFESAAAQCPEWASETARNICENVVAHADKEVSGSGGAAGPVNGTRNSVL